MRSVTPAQYKWIAFGGITVAMLGGTWWHPHHCPSRYPGGPPRWRHTGALDGTSWRTARRPAGYSVGTHAACRSRSGTTAGQGEHSCSRPGRQGGANRRRPRAAGIDDWRVACDAGCGRGPQGRAKAAEERLASTQPGMEITSAATLGQAARHGCRESSCGRRRQPHQPSKVVPGRRRFAPAQPGDGTVGFDGRRDEDVSDARPKRAR